MDKSVITVTIFGSEYTIKGVAEPDYIVSLAAYLNTKMSEIQEATGLKDEKKIAILAGINICDELNEARKSTKENFVPKENMASVRNRIEGLISLIDKESPSESGASRPSDETESNLALENPAPKDDNNQG
jgi:cell division protein ZapA